MKSENKIRKEKKISSLFSNKKSFEFLFIFIEQKISSHERCHTKKVTDCLVKKLRNNITVTPKSFVFYFNSTILEPIFFQFQSPQSKFCVKITLFILNFKVNNVLSTGIEISTKKPLQKRFRKYQWTNRKSFLTLFCPFSENFSISRFSFQKKSMKKLCCNIFWLDYRLQRCKHA